MLLCWCLTAQAIDTISIHIETIERPQIQAKEIKAEVDLSDKQPDLSLKTKYLFQFADWAAATLHCQVPLNWQHDLWQCDQGKLQAAHYQSQYGLNFRLLSEANALNGLAGMLTLQPTSFSDTSGLHAGEDVEGQLDFKLVSRPEHLLLDYAIDWTSGEVYWEPFYLKGEGHQLTGKLKLENDILQVEHAEMVLDKVGKLTLNGQYDTQQASFLILDAQLPNLDLQTGFPLLFKPFLQNSALQETDLSGLMSFDMQLREGALKAFDLKLKGVTIEDQQHHFGFSELSAHIPWDYDARKAVQLNYAKGHLFNLALGQATINASVNRYAWTAPRIELPILDGALVLNSISAARLQGNWYWHLGADIRNLSMPQLSEAFGWPTMQGDATVHIPQVTFADDQLNANGEIVFKVFDGLTRVTALQWTAPFGEVSTLSANVHMNALDLGELTNTFSFGSIEGRLDGEVSQLVLQNWQPIAFDANFVSTPGKYRKKISQRAVENISALGGAGAVAAIQRSVLRFFEAFNYQKIGLSCLLRHNVCQMDGLPDGQAKSTDRGYTIVKGSGIPAITVKGYNHSVGWDELLNRIKRVTDENSEAIVQ